MSGLSSEQLESLSVVLFIEIPLLFCVISCRVCLFVFASEYCWLYFFFPILLPDSSFHTMDPLCVHILVSYG